MAFLRQGQDTGTKAMKLKLVFIFFTKSLFIKCTVVKVKGNTWLKLSQNV